MEEWKQSASTDRKWELHFGVDGDYQRVVTRYANVNPNKWTTWKWKSIQT